MALLKTRIDQNGRIVIPAEVRRHLGVAPGDEVVLDVGRDDVRISSHAAALGALKRMVREGTGRKGYSVKEFLRERQADAEQEGRIWKRRRKPRG